MSRTARHVSLTAAVRELLDCLLHFYARRLFFIFLTQYLVLRVRLSASDSFATLALYKFIYLLTYLLTITILASYLMHGGTMVHVEIIALYRYSDRKRELGNHQHG